jgi:hypothetical protein
MEEERIALLKKHGLPIPSASSSKSGELDKFNRTT